MSAEGYTVRFSERAEADLENGYRFMARSGFDAAEQWLSGLQSAVEREAINRASVPGRRNVASESERIPGRDLFLIRYVTPGGSPWHIFYELADEEADGITDTLSVAYIRHAARGA